MFCNVAECQLLTEHWLDVRTSGLFPVKPSLSPCSLQASVSRPCNISGRYYFPLQTNKTTLYFKCHRHPFFFFFFLKYWFQHLFKRAAHEKKNPCFFMLLFPLDYICFGRPLLVELFPLPRSTFNVKCLEMLGSVSFFLKLYCDAKNSLK